jgi:hypothetical protein
MSHFFRNGNTFRIADDNALDIHKHLPVGNYTVKQDPFGNFFLEMIDSFPKPKKLYGNTVRHADRIIQTFLSRDVSTGVLLNGEKGSGKTLLAKQLGIVCAAMDIPTIVINNDWHGDGFNKLIQDIDQPCVILFDEFEKVYGEEEQQAILTLMDGVFPTKKLFVLTCNDKWRINSHMRNRPGRLFYMLEFRGLDVDFITEYCEDNLDDKSHINRICQLSALFAEFNFDMLKALVEEMNRYQEDPRAAMEMLNAKPEYDGGSKYNVSVLHNGKPVEKVNPSTWEGNPLSTSKVRVYFSAPPAVAKKRKDNDGIELEADEDDWNDIQVGQTELVQVLPQEGKFIYKSGETVVTLTKHQDVKFVHWDAL